jgi:hypothetical protein
MQLRYVIALLLMNAAALAMCGPRGLDVVQPDYCATGHFCLSVFR